MTRKYLALLLVVTTTLFSNVIATAADPSLFYRVSADGARTRINGATWFRTSAVAAMDAHLYIIQGEVLHKVTPDGNYVRLTPHTWSNTTAMAAMGDSLYVMAGNSLHTVKGDGTVGRLRPEIVWHNTQAMAALNGHLYIAQNGVLHKVKPDGTYQRHTPHTWDQTAAMTAMGDYLFVVQRNRLHRVSQTGEVIQLRPEIQWWDTTGMASLNGHLYILQNKCIHKVTAAGDYTRFASDVNRGVMTAMGEHLFVIGSARSFASPHHARLEVDTDEHQDDSSTCGPNCAARILRYFGKHLTHQQAKEKAIDSVDSRLIDKCGLGHKPSTLASLMQRHGLREAHVETKSSLDRVLELLSQGLPLVALIEDGGSFRLHYVVLHGFDRAAERLYYTDTNGAQVEISFSDFMNVWDWKFGFKVPILGSNWGNDVLSVAGIHGRTIITPGRSVP